MNILVKRFLTRVTFFVVGTLAAVGIGFIGGGDRATLLQIATYGLRVTQIFCGLVLIASTVLLICGMCRKER